MGSDVAHHLSSPLHRGDRRHHKTDEEPTGQHVLGFSLRQSRQKCHQPLQLLIILCIYFFYFVSTDHYLITINKRLQNSYFHLSKVHIGLISVLKNQDL